MQGTGEQRGKALGRVAGMPESTGPQGSLKTQHLSKQHGNSVSLPGYLNGLFKEKLQTLHQSESIYRILFLPESSLTSVFLALPDPSLQSTFSCDAVIMQFSSALNCQSLGTMTTAAISPLQSLSITLYKLCFLS